MSRLPCSRSSKYARISSEGPNPRGSGTEAWRPGITLFIRSVPPSAMYCTLDRRSCNGRCRAHVVGLVLCSHPPHSTTALHRTKLDFRESGMQETGFPRMSLLGSSVNRGKGKGRSPCTTYLGLPATVEATRVVAHLAYYAQPTFLCPFLWPRKAHRTCRCSCCGRSSSGNRTSLTVMFTSVTLRPVRFSTLFITLLRTASVICGICLPYSTAIERSAAASSVPTSTETPRVWLPPPTPDTRPGTLSRSPLIARAAPPPVCTPSTSWAAMPTILATTASPMVVAPRSL